MKQSLVNNISKSNDFYRGFGSYNNTHSANENEFEDMLNMSMDEYPYIKTRKRRGQFTLHGNNLFGAGCLVYSDTQTNNGVTKKNIYYDGYKKISNTDDNQKQFAVIGKYVAVWPDKKLITTSTTGSLEWSAVPAKIGMTNCKKDGTTPASWAVANPSDTAPTSPSDGQIWIDTDNMAVKEYDSSLSKWLAQDAYTSIATFTNDYRNNVKKGDKITISGATASVTQDYDVLNGEYSVVNVTKSKIIVSGVCSKAYIGPISTNATITISRLVPDMDYICGCNNRLWGCNSNLNEIYCSALGDPSRFYTFAGVSTDSFTATLGTMGAFTGCAAYRGSVLFFKENYIHKVTGYYPAQYQISETHCRGVQDGSWRSIVLADETLFYKSNSDVMAYTGGMPTSVSSAIKGEEYSDAVAGAVDHKLYICMKDTKNEYWLYTYDLETGTWCKEDNIHISSMAYASDFRDLFFKDSDGNTYNVNNTLQIVSTSGALINSTHTQESKLNFALTTAKLFMDKINRTYVNGLKLRVKLEPGTVAHIDVQYDGGNWINVQNLDKPGEYTTSILLQQRTCDYFKVRISGHGEFTLMGLSKTYSEGCNV